MMFRTIALATTMSLLSAAVSTTAHAGENTAESEFAAAPATPAGAVWNRAPSRRPAPKTSSAHVVGEVLAGAAVGAGVAVGTGLLVYQSSQDPDDSVWADLANGLAATALGGALYPLGAGLGVAMVGNIGDTHGSYGATIGGAYLGSLAGVVLGAALASGHETGSGAVLGYLVGAPIGAAIGFNMTLEHDQPSTGLVNVSGGRTRMSLPAVSVTADPLRPRGTVTSIRLMDGRF